MSYVFVVVKEANTSLKPGLPEILNAPLNDAEQNLHVDTSIRLTLMLIPRLRNLHSTSLSKILTFILKGVTLHLIFSIYKLGAFL